MGTAFQREAYELHRQALARIETLERERDDALNRLSDTQRERDEAQGTLIRVRVALGLDRDSHDGLVEYARGRVEYAERLEIAIEEAAASIEAGMVPGALGTLREALAKNSQDQPTTTKG